MKGAFLLIAAGIAIAFVGVSAPDCRDVQTIRVGHMLVAGCQK